MMCAYKSITTWTCKYILPGPSKFLLPKKVLAAGRFRVPRGARGFSEGDRVQFTAPANNPKVANHELGTIESIDGDWRLRLRMDGGRAVELDTSRQTHHDYGYAVTSHSSPGQTAERVLVHVDTALGAKDLLNSRMAYVSILRGAQDAQIFTNDASALGKVLSRDVSHAPAIEPEAIMQKIAPQSVLINEIAQELGMGL